MSAATSGHAASRVDRARQLTHVRVRRSSSRNLDWQPGRVYFLTILEPLRDDRTPALTVRSASHSHRTGRWNPRSTYLLLMPQSDIELYKVANESLLLVAIGGPPVR
jgi:hypothetical protein